jgi:F-type H+-transporting ATPase subunit delta
VSFFISFIKTFIKNSDNKYFSNFIKVIASYGRLDLLPQIATEYNELKLKHNKAAEVLIKSAVEVTSEQKEIIKTALAKKLNTKVNLNFTVDSTLIGGLIIKTGDLVIDSSIRGQLARLLKQLAA